MCIVISVNWKSDINKELDSFKTVANSDIHSSKCTYILEGSINEEFQR